jgi:hypothetical protein
MAQPLDYRNPKSSEIDMVESKPVVTAAVPVEFDMVLVKTEDHAAVAAIGKALAQEQIPFFRTESDASSGRTTSLWVRASDRDRAFQLAGEIFLHRHKLKSYPRQKAPSEGEGLNREVNPLSYWPY